VLARKSLAWAIAGVLAASLLGLAVWADGPGRIPGSMKQFFSQRTQQRAVAKDVAERLQERLWRTYATKAPPP